MRTFSYTLLLAMLMATAATLRSQAPPAPDGRELSLQQYIGELDRAAATLNSRDSAAIHSYRAALPAEWVVRADGPSSHVKTGWLSAALAIQEKNPSGSDHYVQQISQRLAALRQAARAAATSPDDVQRSRSELDRILRASEFGGARGPSWFDLLKARIQNWIWRQFQKLFGHFGHAQAIGNAIAWIWIMITLATLLLTLWAVRYLLRGRLRTGMDLSAATPAGQDRRYWAREAHARAERGDYRGAVHAAYWAAVARMEESNLLPEDRARTPRESLKLLQRATAAYAPMANLTHHFEFIWYGYRAATVADWVDAKQQLEILECLRSSTPAIAGS